MGHDLAAQQVPTRANVRLEPLNLHNQDEFDELLRQRVLCGWCATPAYLEDWRKASDLGHKALFWIHIPPPSISTSSGSDAAAVGGVQELKRIGHIGFQSIPERGAPDSDLELANTDKSVVMIATFFVLKEHRGGGIGRAAMEALEAMTQVPPYGSPSCRVLTLHTLSRRYVEDDGDGSPDAWRHSRDLWAKVGRPTRERGSTSEDWYKRMGYVKWKEEQRYNDTTLDGEKFLLWASFMRKQL